MKIFRMYSVINYEGEYHLGLYKRFPTLEQIKEKFDKTFTQDHYSRVKVDEEFIFGYQALCIDYEEVQ